MDVPFDDPGIAAVLRDEYLRLSGPELSCWVLRDPSLDLRRLGRSTRPPIESQL